MPEHLADTTQLEEEQDGIILSYIRSLTREDSPVRHPAYEGTVKHAEELAPHVFGEGANLLIEEYRPREDKTVHEYRATIAEAITMTESEKAINVIQRIFTPGFFAIKHPDPPGSIDTPQDYFEGNFGIFKSPVKYGSDVLIRCLVGDANSVLVLFAKRTEGEFPEIIPVIYNSVQVLDKSSHQFTILLEEKSPVKIGQRIEFEGNILLIITENETIRAEQIGEQKDNNYNIFVLDQHDLGWVPARTLGGDLWSKKGITYFRSYFSGAVPYWNKVVRLSSDLDAMLVTAAYPQVIRLEISCHVCHGEGFIIDDQDDRVDCRNCRGTGVEFASSPYGAVVIDPRVTDLKPSDALEWKHAPTDGMELTRKEIDRGLERAMSALNMEIVFRVGDNQSGRAKALDRQDLHGFLSSISATLFDLVEFIYEGGIRYRYGSVLSDPLDVMPEIQRPHTFDHISFEMLLEEAQAAKNAGLHPSYIKKLNMQIAIKKFGKNSDTANRIITETELDPYLGYSEDKILALNAIGKIVPEQLFLHSNITWLVDKAIENDKDFLDKPLKEQLKALMILVSENMPSNSTIDAT